MIMEDKKKIKLTYGVSPQNSHPILGTPVRVDGGAYIVKNRAFVGKIYTVVCPKCQKPLLVKAPSAKIFKATCKACGTSVCYRGMEEASKPVSSQEAKLKEKDADKPNPTYKYGRPEARLEWGGFLSRKHYNIQRSGKHYIGRDDDELRSDISIQDEYVSRRSVLIEAIPKGGKECLYKLTVNSATNPVLINGQAKNVGESIYLNYGDTILVGNTTLTFKRGTK